ncbi:MAG: uracil-DNA glycosylase [Elusimicrobia bacterium HGW-Elusimicrobia-4]|nr:MAG: uracil-DNA glycosylase [Elusimicrobia bacterium HGW-Elusimicrobia-4]
MTYFNETVRLTKKYIEQLKTDGIADAVVSGKGINVKKIKKTAVVDKLKEKSHHNTVSLTGLAEEIKNCKKCPLHKSRKNAVPGEGSSKAKLMFIGEGPGFDEDRLGRPFVGRSGQLLDKIISAMGMKREDVFIANIVKCHPMIDPLHPDERGNDRKPTSDEINGCIGYVEKQIEIIKPKIICALGSVSATTLTGIKAPLGELRGKFHDYKGIKLMPTFHPAALLRNPNWKKDAWEDMKKIMKELARE